MLQQMCLHPSITVHKARVHQPSTHWNYYSVVCWQSELVNKSWSGTNVSWFNHKVHLDSARYKEGATLRLKYQFILDTKVVCEKFSSIMQNLVESKQFTGSSLAFVLSLKTTPEQLS